MFRESKRWFELRWVARSIAEGLSLRRVYCLMGGANDFSRAK
jgi:hypothetical protein